VINDAFRHARDIPLLADDAGSDRGLHSVLAIGMGSSSGPVLVQNSWGPHWGNDGRMWIAGSYIEARCTTVISLAPSEMSS
jgi:C1A family cysteine protease